MHSSHFSSPAHTVLDDNRAIKHARLIESERWAFEKADTTRKAQTASLTRHENIATQCSVSSTNRSGHLDKSFIKKKRYLNIIRGGI